MASVCPLESAAAPCGPKRSTWIAGTVVAGVSVSHLGARHLLEQAAGFLRLRMTALELL
jgi:hypothetical protein